MSCEGYRVRQAITGAPSGVSPRDSARRGIVTGARLHAPVRPSYSGMLVRRIRDAIVVCAAASFLAGAPVTHGLAHRAQSGELASHHDDRSFAPVDEHVPHGHLSSAVPRTDDGSRDHAAIAPRVVLPVVERQLAAPVVSFSGATARDAARAPPRGRAPPTA